MPNDAPTIFETWIYATLVANSNITTLVGNNSESATPNVYHQKAPARGYSYPMIVYQSLREGGTDLLGLHAQYVWTDDLWMVKAIGREQGMVNGVAVNDLPKLRQLAYWIKIALHGQGGATADGKVLWSEQVEPLVLPPDVIAGVSYLQRGGVFRMLAQ